MSKANVIQNTRLPNVVLFDIECTNLNANFGYMLCVGYKKLGEKNGHCISITDFPAFHKDPTNDYYVTKAAGEALRDADVLIGWYSTKFDLPYLQTRLLYHKLPTLPPIQHVDGWKIAKYKMKLNSNRLASLSAFLEVEDKTPLTGPIWIKAAAGHKPSVKYVVDHCIQDVEVLEQVYDRIKPLMTNHPGMGVILGKLFACPVCGGEKLQKRGYHMSRTRKYQRYHCQKCGAWSNDGKALSKTVLR